MHDALDVSGANMVCSSMRKVGGWTSVRETEACGCVRVMRGHSQDYQLKFLTVDAAWLRLTVTNTVPAIKPRFANQFLAAGRYNMMSNYPVAASYIYSLPFIIHDFTCS